MVFVILFVFGLCLGSFVNALVWRIHAQVELQAKQGKRSQADAERLERLSISKGRSMCLSCGHELQGKDLIPVLSWLSLRGKCRYCGARIPDTPVAELLVPALFVLSYAVWPFHLVGSLAVAVFVAWLLCLVAFVALALYDIRWFILPDRITLPLIPLAVVYAALHVADQGLSLSGVLGPVFGVVVVAGLFYGLFVASDGKWIGGGDVKLGVALGLLAGSFLDGLMVILFASVFGILAAVPQMVKGKVSGTTKIPFGPFLLLATVVVVLWGGAIGDWYLGLLSY